MIEPVTYEHVDQIMLSTHDDPALIRRHDGGLEGASDPNRLGVICTRTTYVAYSRCEDTVQMRVNFAAYLNSFPVTQPPREA